MTSSLGQASLSGAEGQRAVLGFETVGWAHVKGDGGDPVAVVVAAPTPPAAAVGKL